MTVHENFPLQAETLLLGQKFSRLRKIMLHEAVERNLTVVTDGSTQIILQTPLGLISFEERDAAIFASVHADKPDRLYMIKENLTLRLSALAPELPALLRWSGAGQTGALPGNFHFATVQSVTPLCSTFLRVTIKADDLSSFGDASIHFRLALTPEGLGQAEWPHLGENGIAVWPKGETAFHRPVYTARRVDPVSGTLDFDVFIHEGGRVTNWAQSANPGDTVALTGPGGGGIPQTDRIAIYADETAFPAVARILETLPESTIGHAYLLADQGQDNGYEIPNHSGIELNWLARPEGHNLADIALKQRPDMRDHFWWFASEKADTMRIRSIRKEENKATSEAYIANYWSKAK